MYKGSIAILTFQNADNYGAVLQNFALQEAIKKHGYSVETIDYRCQEIDLVYEVSFLEKVKRIFVKPRKNLVIGAINFFLMRKRKMLFQQFRKDFLFLSEPTNRVKVQEKICQYSLVIVGSDQVWNSQIIKQANTEVFSLRVAKGIKTASYAASAGSNECLAQETIDAIKYLDIISVREKSLQTYLDKKSVRIVHHACDPVFLLDKLSWKTLMPNMTKIKKSYVFVYYVDSNNLEACAIAKKIANEKKLSCKFCVPIAQTTWSQGKQIYHYGPVGFLTAIAGAEIVVASSFHAVAFSVIFEKEFVALLHEQTGSRVYDLLQMLGLESRIVKDLESYLIAQKSWTPIDFQCVKKRLNEFVTHSSDVLRHICELADEKEENANNVAR